MCACMQVCVKACVVMQYSVYGLYMHVCMCACVYVCTCVCVYVCMCVHVCVCVCLFLTYYAYIHMSYAVANELIKLYCGISYYTNWVVSFKYLKVCVVIHGPCPNSILRMCSLLYQHKLCVVYITCV